MEISAEELGAMESRAWEYGRKLGECLFADLNLRRALAFARGPNMARVSVRIEIDPAAAELQGLLWERLILTNGDEEIAPAVHSRFALSRGVLSEEAVEGPGEGVFRLLAVIASPAELRELPDNSPLKAIDIPAEIRNLRRAWDGLVQRGLMCVTILAAMDAELQASLLAAGYRVAPAPVSLEAISDALSGFDSLHLICHGAFKGGVARLLLEDATGKQCTVTEEEFLPRLGTRSLRLVFLQACQSASREPGVTNVFSGLGPKVAQRAAAVIAMQDFVRVEDAARFAQEFYDVLLATGSAAQAANAGRLVLFRPDSMSWAIPALYLAPKADPLWQPDTILAASQDLAARFRERPDLTAPFPVEVIRQTPGTSSSMETSPPGPRMRVSDAVAGLLFPTEGEASQVVVLAGNYGRAKTAQLYSLYTEYAAKVSRGGPLPLFVRASDFVLTDMRPAEAVARAIAKTYASEAEIALPVDSLARRLSQPFILFLEGDLVTDSRRCVTAFEMAGELVEGRRDASIVVTMGEHAVAGAEALKPLSGGMPPILLVQLLSPASVSQYLTALPGSAGKNLLAAIERSNLFDLACVPWLLSCLIRQSNRANLSRSGVIARIVAGNMAVVDWAPGIRRMVSDALGRFGWIMQTGQLQRLTGNRLYEVLGDVRGRREEPLDHLRDKAFETRLVCLCDEDSLRFAYPGFQSFWCAQHLIDKGASLGSYLDDITATLGRRSRIRLWEDTLVLLSGLMDKPDRLVRRILTGSSLGQGGQVFLAATCIHEARLSDRTVSADLVCQVFDNLVWRSTPVKESSAAVRVRAIECLGLLREASTVPHLLSLAIERIRTTGRGALDFEFSGIRQAAVQVLLTMREEAEAHLRNLLSVPNPTASLLSIPALIKAWRSGDCAQLQAIFHRGDDGVPAIVAFAMGTIGGEENLEFLAGELRRPGAAEDTVWAIADALLPLNPVQVTRRAVRPAYGCPDLHALTAYTIGKLQIAVPGDQEFRFLIACLESSDAKTQGMALRALAQLGDSSQRATCEYLASERWGHAAAQGFPIPETSGDRATLRFYALESLRLIGTVESANCLRVARHTPGQGRSDDFMSLSYEVTEDIYRRCTGGCEGDSFEQQDPAR